jgi:hypothetical protein
VKMSASWGSSKTSRRGRRTVLKTKIRWEVLGLPDPALADPAPSMKDIRRQITSMASRGFGPGTRSRSNTKDSSTDSGSDAPATNRKRRRGATE